MPKTKHIDLKKSAMEAATEADSKEQGVPFKDLREAKHHQSYHGSSFYKNLISKSLAQC